MQHSAPPVDLSAKILFPKRDAALFLSLSIRTVDNLIRLGELRPRRIGKRVLFSRDELQRFARGDHATRPARGNGQAAGGGPTS